MKAIKPIIILLLTSFGTVHILSQTNAVLNYLPGDAKMVIKINSGSLRQKMKWDELRKYKVFTDIMKDFPETGKGFLDNPGSTGLDLSQGFFLEIPQDKNNEKLDPVFYAIPRDTAMITTMVRKIFPGKQPIKTPNGKLIVDRHTVLAWNNEIVMLTGDDAKKGSATKNAKVNPSAESTRMKHLSDRGKSLLSKRQSSFKNPEYFTQLIKEEGDLLLWINNTVQSQTQKKTKVPEAFGMLNKGFMRKGNYTSCRINFENGKVVMEMKQYVSESLDSFYKRYPVKNINAALLKKLPAGQPIFIFSFSFSPQMTNEMLVKAGADKLLDSLSKKNVRVADILAALKGDAMLVALKVPAFAEEDTITQKMGGIQVFLAGNINDKEKFRSLSELLQKKKDDSTKNNAPAKMKPLIFSNDSIFVVSLSPFAAQTFLASAGNNEEMGKFIYPYENHPALFMLDLRTVFGFLMQSMVKGKSEEEVKQASEVLGMFDKLVSYGGEYQRGFASSTVELTLTNKDENSLKQFINLIEVFNSLKPKSSTAYNEALPGQ